MKFEQYFSTLNKVLQKLVVASQFYCENEEQVGNYWVKNLIDNSAL